VITKTIPIIGWVWLAYDLADLVFSFNDPVERELSPYQMQNAKIVANVKAYLEGKKEAAWLNEAIQHPFEPSKYLKPLQKDRFR
jgi:hypothetical protein